MAFKYLEQRMREHKAEFMTHVSEEVVERVMSGVPMEYGEWYEFCGNNYERRLLYPLLTDEALGTVAMSFMCNSRTPFVASEFDVGGSNYDEVLIRVLVPLMAKRLAGRS